MKAKDLRSMSKDDLNSKLAELRKELIKHNAQISTGTTPKSPGQVREIKKTIAKILTIANTQETKEPESDSKLEDKKSSSVSTKQEEQEKAKEGKMPKDSGKAETESKAPNNQRRNK